MRKILPLILAALSACAWGQGNQNNFNSGGNGVGIYTVATLPAAPTKATLATVKDGSTSSDCSTGAGSNVVVCIFNGSSWVFAGNSGSNPTFAQVGNGTNAGALLVSGTFGPSGGTVTANAISGTPSITINGLSATTINGAAFAGTFTGAPTFSGNTAFTGTPTFSNALALGSSTATTQSAGTNNTTLATTAFVHSYAPLAGATFTGEVVTVASATGTAGLNLPPGAAPTAPVNGDLWSTSSGFFGRVAGVTVGPFSASGGGGNTTSTSLTTGFYAEANGANSIINGTCDSGITTANTFTCSDTAGIAGVSFTGSGSNGGYVGTQGTGANVVFGAGKSGFYPDSVNNCLHQNLNNVDKNCIPNTAGSGIGLTTGGTISVSAAPLSDLATQAADSVVMNATGSTAVPTAVAMPTCATSGHADVYDPSTHAWTCNVLSGGTSTIANGTSAMGTGAISSGTCATVVTTTATGVAATDAIIVSPNADPTGVTGYAVSATGSLYIQSWPTSGNVNFKVCNNTAGSLTPAALTLNWRVVR